MYNEPRIFLKVKFKHHAPTQDDQGFPCKVMWQIFTHVYYECIVSPFSINSAKWGRNSPISKSTTMHLASNAEGDTARPNAETLVMGWWVWKVTHLLNMVEALFCAFNTSGPIKRWKLLVEVACCTERTVIMKYEVANATLLNWITEAEISQQHAPHDTLPYVCYVRICLLFDSIVLLYGGTVPYVVEWQWSMTWLDIWMLL